MQSSYLILIICLNFFGINYVYAAKHSFKKAPEQLKHYIKTDINLKQHSKPIKKIKSKPTKVCLGCDILQPGETVESYCLNFTSSYAAEELCLAKKPNLQNIMACHGLTKSTVGELICLKNEVSSLNVKLCSINSTDEVNEVFCLLGMPEIEIQKFGDCYTLTEDYESERLCFIEVLKQKFGTDENIIQELQNLEQAIETENAKKENGVDI